MGTFLVVFSTSHQATNVKEKRRGTIEELLAVVNSHGHDVT
jgi:hypothetical protein